MKKAGLIAGLWTFAVVATVFMLTQFPKLQVKFQTQHSEERYKLACLLLDADAFDDAITEFQALGEYKDSAHMLLESKFQKASYLATIGDYYNMLGLCFSLEKDDSYSEKVPGLYYELGCTLRAKGDLGLAAKSFYIAGDHLDAQAQSLACQISLTRLNTVAIYNDTAVAILNDGTVTATNPNLQAQLADWTDIISLTYAFPMWIGLRADGTLVAQADDRYPSDDRTKYIANALKKQADIFSISNAYAIKMDGRVVGLTNESSFRPNDPADIFVAQDFLVGRNTDGTVWFFSFEQPGLPLTEQRQAFIADLRKEVFSWNNIVQLAACNDRIIGLKADGTLVAAGAKYNKKCWVTYWTDIVSIQANGASTYALRKDGTVMKTDGETHTGKVIAENIGSIYATDYTLLLWDRDGVLLPFMLINGQEAFPGITNIRPPQ